MWDAGSQQTGATKTAPTGPARDADPGPDPRSLQRALDQARRDAGIPGASAAVLVPGEGLWVGTSGLADVRSRRRVTRRTMFAAGSVTKTIVSALVLKLAEQDVLSLDDRLARWVPDFPNAKRITIRQLLNHTAGTADFVGVSAFERALRRSPGAVWTPERTLRHTGYILLGLVIERATGSTAAKELHRRLLPRASYPRMLLQGDERPSGSVATGYQDLDGDLRPEAFKGAPFIPTTAEATSAWTAGGLATSAGDLARALDGILAGDLLSDESRRAMTTWVDAGDPPEYGLGLARDELAGEEAWGHIGDITGFHADAWHFPESGVTLVALANLQAGEVLGARQDVIARALAGVLH